MPGGKAQPGLVIKAGGVGEEGHCLQDPCLDFPLQTGTLWLAKAWGGDWGGTGTTFCIAVGTFKGTFLLFGAVYLFFPGHPKKDFSALIPAFPPALEFWGARGSRGCAGVAGPFPAPSSLPFSLSLGKIIKK